MSNNHTQNSERDFLERKRKEFKEQTTKFVGQGGWVTGTDNDEGYAIHPHMYDDVWSFIQQAISEAREEGALEKIKEIEGMKKNYHYTDDGFDPDVPYSKYVGVYDQAIDDVIAILKK